mgnify:CR=1 FL=1
MTNNTSEQLVKIRLELEEAKTNRKVLEKMRNERLKFLQVDSPEIKGLTSKILTQQKLVDASTRRIREISAMEAAANSKSISAVKNAERAKLFEIRKSEKVAMSELNTDLRIKSKLKINAANEAIREQQRANRLAKVSDIATGLGTINSKVPTEQLEIMRRRLGYLRSEGKLLLETGADSERSLKNLRETAKLQKEIKDLQNKINPPFAGWALSVMFAGMAMQRFATQVTQFGTKAYDDIAHSIEGTVTANDRLNASMTFLGFSVGEALQPLLEMIVPLIDYIAKFVNDNPEFVSNVTGAVTVLGGVLAAIGGIVLAKNGAITALKEIGIEASGLNAIGAITISAYLAFKGISDIVEGDYIGGIAKLLATAGLAAIVTGRTGAGAVLVTISLAMELVDILVKDKKLTPDSLANFLIQAGVLGAFVSGPVGAALLTIGLGLKLVNSDDFKNKFITILGLMFGVLATLIGVLIDAILSPLTLAVEGLIAIYNAITPGTKGDINFHPFGALTKYNAGRMRELMDQWNSLNASPTTNNGLTVQGYSSASTIDPYSSNKNSFTNNGTINIYTSDPKNFYAQLQKQMGSFG